MKSGAAYSICPSVLRTVLCSLWSGQDCSWRGALSSPPLLPSMLAGVLLLDRGSCASFVEFLAVTHASVLAAPGYTCAPSSQVTGRGCSSWLDLCCYTEACVLLRVFIPRGQSYFHLTISHVHIGSVELLAAVGSHTARLSVGSRLHTLQVA